MANFASSLLATGQAKLLGAFQSKELKYIDPVTYLQFKKGGLITDPMLNDLRLREDRPVEAYYLVRRIRAAASARAHNHTGTRSDSAVFTPSWATKAFSFAMSLKQADRNMYSLEEQYTHELKNVILSATDTQETLAADFIFNNRSGVNTASASLGSFNATQKAYEISATNYGTRFVQIATQVMYQNAYQGALVFFCDGKSYVDAANYMMQGSNNAVNTSFQFQGHTFVNSTKLDTKALGLTTPYSKGFMIACQADSLGALDWIPKQNRAGVDTKVNEYSTVLNPVDGLNWALHTYETRVDGSSTGGYTQDVETQFEVSLDIALHSSPLSTANETVLQAFALV